MTNGPLNAHLSSDTRCNIFIKKSIKDIINLKVNKKEWKKNDEQQYNIEIIIEALNVNHIMM